MSWNGLFLLANSLMLAAGMGGLAVAQTAVPSETLPESLGEQLELDPDLVNSSPTLQRWAEEVPDVLQEIRTDPSFRTRLRVGYTTFPSTDGTGGVALGVEDWFVGNTPLTVSADYQRNFRGDRESYGVDLRYYTLPLGGYVNVAPVLGYRSVTTSDYSIDGLNAGFQIKLIPSRGGGADFAYTQTWVNPSGGQTARITELSLGYAITRQLRLATEIEWQFAPGHTDSRVGIGVEWLQ